MNSLSSRLLITLPSENQYITSNIKYQFECKTFFNIILNINPIYKIQTYKIKLTQISSPNHISQKNISLFNNTLFNHNYFYISTNKQKTK